MTEEQKARLDEAFQCRSEGLDSIILFRERWGNDPEFFIDEAARSYRAMMDVPEDIQPKVPCIYDGKDRVNLSYFLAHMADTQNYNGLPEKAELFEAASQWVTQAARSVPLLQQRIRELKEGLRFYADKENYAAICKQKPDALPGDYYATPSIIEQDEGQRARDLIEKGGVS